MGGSFLLLGGIILHLLPALLALPQIVGKTKRKDKDNRVGDRDDVVENSLKDEDPKASGAHKKSQTTSDHELVGSNCVKCKKCKKMKIKKCFEIMDISALSNKIFCIYLTSYLVKYLGFNCIKLMRQLCSFPYPTL